MVEYLSTLEVLLIQVHQIKVFGGAKGVRDYGALESALFRPKTGYYADLIEEAAALWESLSQNDPFLDGNKRTAFPATDVFLRINGIHIQADPIVAFDEIISLYESGTFEHKALVKWLRSHVAPS